MTFLIISALAIFLSVILGGTFALKFKDKLHLILGFSAGSVIGVAFFDLLPEAFRSGKDFYQIETIALFIIMGFLIYMISDRLLTSHSHHEEECVNHNCRGVLGAGSISLHSLVDGLVVGFSFQISTAVGIALAVAIFAHAFSDGINTVNMVLKNNGTRNQAFKWLLVDAIAPVLGVISTLFFSVPATTLGIILAIFTGFFLYIGASDLLPESHHCHPTAWTTFATILGFAVLYGAINLAGI